MRHTAAAALALLLLALPAPSAQAAGKVTLDGLLKQMTELSQLAEYPDPPYVAKQFSSYDRRSEAPGVEEWFANDDHGFMLYDGVVKEKTPYFKTGPMQMKGPDGEFAAGTKVGIARNRKPVGGYVWAYATGPDGGPADGKIPQGFVSKDAITMDPQGHVLAEMDGPGCVVRIWSANPQDAGKVHVYFDEGKEPVIEAPLTELLGGKWKTKVGDKEVTPFPDPLACERSRGFNLYFPLAYAKHCKITIDKPDIYYHVDYRTYPKGTEVETFTFGAYADKAKDVAAVVEGLHKDVAAPAKDKYLEREVRPGERWEIYGRHGVGEAGVVQGIDVLVKDDADALRGLVLVGTFEDSGVVPAGGSPVKPQLWCPLGDFFGTGPGANPYGSLPFSVTVDKDGQAHLAARWPMPFEKYASLQIHNLGKKAVKVSAAVASGPYKWTDRSMHFHARWRTETFKTRPFRDWTYCDLKGQGVFVGDCLNVFNPVTAWWGEGDEKIYVDGEKFPSWFGTGTEDYYGYAWSDPKPFQHAYHNQTRCDRQTRGHTSVNRFHVLDAIPFEKSFRFDMEAWHWTPNVEVTYAATSYWYARPGATDDFKEPDAKVLQTIPALPPPYKVEGALEGEKLKVLKKSSEFELGPQDMTEFTEGKWSGEQHLWGRPPKKGEWADLELPVAADGTYEVVVYLTKARDYGEVQFSLDGTPLGKPIDGFHADTVVATGPVSLGTATLKKGTATLRVEVVGSNEKSDGLRYMWGLDCIVLKPAKP
jgi:Protein of unknown function (DUF2961)